LNRKPDASLDAGHQTPVIKHPSLPATNVERLRKGALATKQSIPSFRCPMDCFAALAMTVDGFSGLLAALARNDG
jgi:hypothetical protein